MATRTTEYDDLTHQPADPPIRTAASQTIENDGLAETPPPPRKTNRKCLAVGVVLTAIGISMLLFIGIGFVEQFELLDMSSLPVVAVLLLLGLLSVGGGFGMMMAAAPGFDDDEFDRLLAGNPLQKSIDEGRQQEDNNDAQIQRADGGDSFEETATQENPLRTVESSISDA